VKARFCWKNPDSPELEFFDSFCENLLAYQEPRRHVVGVIRYGIGCAGLHSVACADGIPYVEAVEAFGLDHGGDLDARGILPELIVHLIAELAQKVEEVGRHSEMC
jgi:hypothetical protein